MGKADVNEEETKATNIGEISTSDKEKITQELVSTHFSVFLDKIKKKQPRLYAAMKNQEVKLNEQKQVMLFFQNNAQLEDFKLRLKPSLVSHLCEAIGISSIEIIDGMMDAEKLEKPKLFNDNEKFKAMSEKNPALLKLKSLFNLDFD